MNPEDFFKAHTPHNLRRAHHHNYKAPGYYMISISKHPSAPDFSRLQGEPNSELKPPSVCLELAGQIINQGILSLKDSPEFEIINYVIMPDHVHLLWRVKTWLSRDLGHYVALFKSRCLRGWKETNNTLKAELRLFLPKFNDRIAYNEAMARRFSRYIADNPRRRITALKCPELFKRAVRVSIGDKEMDAFGNFQLLRFPLISAVVVSSRDSDAERAAKTAEWEETLRGGGVFVSAFISKEEKGWMARAIAEGASIIRIIGDGLGPRYKPSGLEFDLCAQGRCLHIGLPRQSAHKDRLSRGHCLEMNAMAVWIATHPDERMKLISARQPKAPS